MSKFKVGDRVIGNAEATGRYTFTVEGWEGVVIEVLGPRSFRAQHISGSGPRYILEDDFFNLVGEKKLQKIVVTTDGKITTARLFSGKELVKSSEAKCSPCDEFVFETGAALALDRLLDREKKAEPEKLFPLEDIKAGYLLKIRNADGGKDFYMTVIPGLSYNVEKLGVCCPGKHWWALDSFGEDLRKGERVIQEIWGYCHNKFLLDNSTADRELLWSRK